MKTVGIVTLLGNNYGGCLQGYALNKIIQEYNFETFHLDVNLDKRYNIKEFIKLFVYIKRNYKFYKYRKEYFNIKDNLNCDYYITGSDQVWNPQIPFAKRKAFFLDFAKTIKISYAASIGTNTLDTKSENIWQIKNMLNSFDYISVREKTAQQAINQLIDKPVDVVLDPTLLLDNKTWMKHAVFPEMNHNYIFTYFLGMPNKIKQVIDDFSKEYNCGIINVSYKRFFLNEIKHVNDLSPQDFIGYIYNSCYVITNSFHGVVFSLIFHKPFYVVTRGNMNSRIIDLLTLLNLENRIINENKLEQIKYEENNNFINYKHVDEILKKEKIKSIDFLKKALDIEDSE